MRNRQIFVLQSGDTCLNPEQQDGLLKFIPDFARERFKNIGNANSRLQSIYGELLTRYALRQITGIHPQDFIFASSENGKPFLENFHDIHFNISHAGGLVVCAVDEKEVGVDVEVIRKARMDVAERFFAPAEFDDLRNTTVENQAEYFTTLWSIKESYLKAIGKGLTQQLDSFVVKQVNGRFKITGDIVKDEFIIEKFKLATGYIISVCSCKPEIQSSLVWVEMENMLNSIISAQ